MSTTYKVKYLKYKLKYLELKKSLQIGAGIPSNLKGQDLYYINRTIETPKMFTVGTIIKIVAEVYDKKPISENKHENRIGKIEIMYKIIRINNNDVDLSINSILFLDKIDGKYEFKGSKNYTVELKIENGKLQKYDLSAYLIPTNRNSNYNNIMINFMVYSDKFYGILRL